MVEYWQSQLSFFEARSKYPSINYADMLNASLVNPIKSTLAFGINAHVYIVQDSCQ